MITIKYKVEVPNLNKEKNWIDEVYKKSWFYSLYKIELINFFIPRKEFEGLNDNEKMLIFSDFVRFMKGALKGEDFLKFSFEMIFIFENKNRVFSDRLNLKNHPPLILIKHTLFRGKYEASYQLLEDIKTINFLENDYC